MSGMDPNTGKTVDGAAHIALCIADILRTPVGTRCMRRNYGSRLPELVDAPMNAATRQLIAAASAGAIARWEKRVKLSRVTLTTGSADGRLELSIEGTRTDTALATRFSTRIAL